jgi:hypothetical protein
VRATGLLVLAPIALVVAGRLVVIGWRHPRPALHVVTARLHRAPHPPRRADSPIGRLGALATTPTVAARTARWGTTLRLIGRPPEVHVGLLLVGGLAGLATPALLAGAAAALGVTPVGFAVPAAVALVAAAAVPLLVHADAASDADAVRTDLRHQLSAYLDLVTMLLAGNTGHEGALARAAATGDGLLFRELRRRLREVGATGRSGIDALALVAEDHDLDELRQVAATASLSAAEGAPVARTLAAKCATLRSTMAADHEARARVRNDKVTPPLVGMALLFMVLIIYPALSVR